MSIFVFFDNLRPCLVAKSISNTTQRPSDSQSFIAPINICNKFGRLKTYSNNESSKVAKFTVKSIRSKTQFKLFFSLRNERVSNRVILKVGK